VAFSRYAAHPELVVGTASFPLGLDTAGCGTNKQLSTQFPSFNTTAAQAALLHTLSWRGGVIATTAAATGLGNLGANGLDCGPVVSTDSVAGKTLVCSPGAISGGWGGRGLTVVIHSGSATAILVVEPDV